MEMFESLARAADFRPARGDGTLQKENLIQNRESHHSDGQPSDQHPGPHHRLSGAVFPDHELHGRGPDDRRKRIVMIEQMTGDLTKRV